LKNRRSREHIYHFYDPAAVFSVTEQPNVTELS